MKAVDLFLFFFFSVALGLGLFVMWSYLPGEKVIFTPVSVPTTEVPTVPSKIQFYPFMRYSEPTISYFIYSACDQEKEQKVIDSFSLLESQTVLRFVPGTQQSAELEIFCSDLPPAAEERNHFVAGEGGPSKVINTSTYYVILHGKVSLYRNDPCDEPKVALHEVLHALGFDHSQDPTSIMYPITNCRQELDRYIVDAINEMYALPSRADLVVLEAQATTQGRYLSFHVSVANVGLKDASDVRLLIKGDGELVKEFELETITLGTKKYLDVENVRLPSTSIRDLTFAIASGSGEEEMTLKNNELTLTFGSS